MVTLALLLLWHFLNKYHPDTLRNKHPQNSSIVPLSNPSGINKQIAEARNRITHIVKPGDSFMSILTSLNIRREDAIDCYRSLKPLGLPALFPGDSLIIKATPDGAVENLSLLSRLQHWYHISGSDSILTAERNSVNTDSYTYLVNGALETSLSEDLNEMGVGDGLTAKFADIFAWDINFFLDPRKGDTFQILFEEKFVEGKSVGYGEILAARYTCNGKDFYAIGLIDEKGRILYYDLKGNSVQKQFLKAPLRYSRISSRYSRARLHPILGIVRPHLGVDYAAPSGTPVHSAADGRVRFAGWKNGFGKYVEILHGASYTTSYGHLNSILTHAGARVAQGQMIGTVGATGMATGAHLDYRMKIGIRFVNPTTVSLPSCKGVNASQKDQFEKNRQACLTAFGLRFTNQEGCHVLHIDRQQPRKIAVSQVRINRTQVTNGAKPNS